jgi:hypothetical protein
MHAKQRSLPVPVVIRESHSILEAFESGDANVSTLSLIFTCIGKLLDQWGLIL